METMEMTTASAAAEKPGSKLTKLGWLPEDWEVKKLDDVAEIHNHLRFPLSETVRKGMQGPYPYYGPTKAQDYLDHFRVDGKYVLIGEDGDHFLKFQTHPMTLLVDGQYNVNNHAHLIKGTNSCETEWIYWFFNARDLTNDITRQGVGRYKLTKDALKKLVLVVPPVPEQQAIINILNALSSQERGITRLIESKRAYKSGLMQQLLTGQRRFPEFQGQPWREFRLGEVFKDFSQLNRNNEDLPILSCSKVYGIVLQETLFGRRIASADIRRYKVVADGDLVYDPMLLWDASLGFVASVPRGVISPAYVTLRYTGDAETKALLEHALYNEELRFQYKLISRGTNVRRQKAPSEDFLKIKLSLPTSSVERGKIAAVFTACDQEIELLQAQLRQWQQQKKGLMQQLLTGQLRVPH